MTRLKWKSKFTVEDVRKINERMKSGKARDHSGLSPASQRILRSVTFSAEEINKAFAEAREALGYSK